MTRRLLVACLVLALVLPAWLGLEGAVALAEARRSWKGQLVWAIDGDSVVVMRGRRHPVVVRLWGIDAPEHDQPYGDQARARLAALAGSWVRVHTVDLDRHGRLVGRITLDGADLGAALVAEGLAWHWPKYAPEAAELAAAQAKARAGHLGLWRDAHPVAPWVHRAEPDLDEGA